MSTTKSFGTLSEFLMQAGTEYIIYDISRARRLVSNQEFFDYELNNEPFPTPRQAHAWLCIVFWNKQIRNKNNEQEHYIWFIKLPIDERGLIMQAARDQFLHIVVEALGQDMQRADEKQAQLPENPFVFAPSQQQLADCNASIRKQLKLPEREGFSKAKHYISAPSVQSWNDLSVQDMSDLAVNINAPEIANALAQNFDILPTPVAICLCSTFEGIPLPPRVSDSLLAYHTRCETSLAPMVLRALASTNTVTVDKHIEALILEKNLDTETLIVIAGRHWQRLIPNGKTDDLADSLLASYLEQLANADSSYALFKGVFADLVRLPSLRTFLLAMIRQPLGKDALQLAVTHLLSEAESAPKNAHN
ncbi:DUF3549 family protein [Ningiella sp. W23]|uniref:DUF3549 family protein n=1 Tax=Ningiella sp. W23 TaxID=3023715 RepID=UPI003757CB8B